MVTKRRMIMLKKIWKHKERHTWIKLLWEVLQRMVKYQAWDNMKMFSTPNNSRKVDKPRITPALNLQWISDKWNRKYNLKEVKKMI